MPETVHHVVVNVDPVKDPSWMGLRNHVQTDDVHKRDDVSSRARESAEKRSEGVKILKGLSSCTTCIHSSAVIRASNKD